MDSFDNLINKFLLVTKEIYGNDYIPLHRPVFEGNEKLYLTECIDSNFVSSVGQKVTDFENSISNFVGSKFAVATVNGTAALHVAIELANVKPGEEVISQALTFIATCNAISYSGAVPIFVDVDIDTMGMSPQSLTLFLENFAEKKSGNTYNKKSGRRIGACIPMHTFGFPCRIKEIKEICHEWNIPLIEDAAESLGSYCNNQHTGTFGEMGTLSFNGNKLITTGGGGMIVTDNEGLAKKAKHITTTAKIPHAYNFVHDEVAYNYRMPNLNAALGCAQIEKLHEMIAIKEQISSKYGNFFKEQNINFFKGIDETKPNYWLNTLVLKSKNQRDHFLERTNSSGVMTRPIWQLMSRLKMFESCQHDGLVNSIWLQDRVVNIPSSVPNKTLLKQKL